MQFDRANSPQPGRSVKPIKNVQHGTKPSNSPASGIAVSGGVDSMALAKFCSIISSQKNDFPSFKAYVVDHKARKESSEEAQEVLLYLKALDLEAQLLTLDWGPDPSSHKIANFETVARQKRYRALTRACLDDGINCLLVGHHKDDLEELALLKLVQGRNPFGSKGIDLVARAAYQNEPHKVVDAARHSNKGETTIATESQKLPKWFHRSESRDTEALHEEQQQQQKQKHKLLPKTSTAVPGNVLGLGKMPIFSGHIQIGRPLLRNRKEALKEYCRESGTPWLEDLSNQDPSLTPRNSIRKLLSDGKLPPSLAKDGLLHRRLSETVWRFCEGPELSGRQLFLDCCKIKSFDLQTGVLIVSLPSQEMLRNYRDTAVDKSEAQIETEFIDALCDIFWTISPRTLLGPSRMTKALDLFGLRMNENVIVPKRFTLGHVMATPLPQASHSTRSTWVLERQPFQKRERLRKYFADVTAPTIDLVTNEWELWDGRFWILAEKKTREALVIEPLTEHLLARFRRALAPLHAVDLGRLIASRCAGSVRFTLPVITCDGNPISLPTLGYSIPKVDTIATWQMQYKNLDRTFSSHGGFPLS
ncbi:MAG: hypothetical protein M1814_006012 [Vezdaea aestivalis]|nr:MAG: hypothetical protein M1814_006012 [Vezdaea aestivalis]